MMKKFTYIVLIFFSFDLLSEYNSKSEFMISKSQLNDYFQHRIGKKGLGWKPYNRWDNFFSNRSDSNGNLPSAYQIFNELEIFKNNRITEIQLNSDWKNLGPNYVPKNKLAYKSSGNGRINCLAFDPVYSNVIWAGSASGGIWKSNDEGASWITFPFTQFLSIGISDIAINPKNTKIVYAATGDANGSFMTKGFSIGIIKTTDGGLNWEITNFAKQITDNILISKILIEPNNPDRLIIATSQGIFKSLDGGNSWFNTLKDKYVKDMVFSSDNSDIIIATTYSNIGNTEILKSIDAGETWNLKQKLINSNRSCIGVSKSNPNILYLVASDKDNNGLSGFYSSKDKGESWNLITSNPNILSQSYKGDEIGGQGFYDLSIAVHPDNFGEIWVGGINIWKSTDGGVNWKIATHWSGEGGAQFVHADHHYLVFNKEKFLFSANDGGISHTQNNGKNWFDISKNLSVTQVYRFDISEKYPNKLILGCQDNGTLYLNSTFEHVGGGDGMDCMLDNKRDSVYYSSIYYGTVYKTNGQNEINHMIFDTQISKEEAEWTAPITNNPFNSDIIYVGHKNIWRSDDAGKNWFKISNFDNGKIHKIIISESDTSVIYIASGKDLWKTINSGNSWLKIYSATNPISSIDISDKESDEVYITVSGYFTKERVLIINKYGVYDISKDLPNININCIVHQNNTIRRLFIGTDIGVFVYEDEKWSLFNNNLPNIIVNDIKINESYGKLYIGTFGRGIWYTDINLCGNNKPYLNVVEDLTICEPNNIILKPKSKWSKIIWSNNSRNDSLIVTKSGEYFAYLIDDNGCGYKTKPLNLTINPLPKLKIFSDNLTFCAGDSVEIFASAGFEKYIWSNNDTALRVFKSKPGKIYCLGITKEGCSTYSDTLNFSTIPSPNKPVISRVSNNLISSKADKYQWYLNSKIINGATNQELKIFEYGDYQVRVFSADNCSSISDIFNVITSVEKNINGNIKLIFSDLSNELKIENLNNIEIEIEIFNSIGIELFKTRIYSDYFINMEKYSNGIYNIRYRIGNDYFNKFIVK